MGVEVSFECDQVDMTKVRKGPGYDDPRAVAARMRILAREYENRDLTVADCFGSSEEDRRDAAELERDIANDLAMLEFYQWYSIAVH